jgi:hypothetical protein
MEFLSSSVGRNRMFFFFVEKTCAYSTIARAVRLFVVLFDPGHPKFQSFSVLLSPLRWSDDCSSPSIFFQHWVK